MLFKNMEVNALNIFYREAGKRIAPKLVLLHGFPASSHQYRNLIPALAEDFHVIAPDYPGIRQLGHAGSKNVRLHVRQYVRDHRVVSGEDGVRLASGFTFRTMAVRLAFAS